MSAGFCCCGGGDTDDEAATVTVATVGNAGEKKAAAPFGLKHAAGGLSPPKSPAMMSDNAPVAGGSPICSDGDADEFFDAPDSLESLGSKWQGWHFSSHVICVRASKHVHNLWQPVWST